MCVFLQWLLELRVTREVCLCVYTMYMYMYVCLCFSMHVVVSEHAAETNCIIILHCISAVYLGCDQIKITICHVLDTIRASVTLC